MIERNIAIAPLALGVAVISMVLVFAPGRFIQRLAIYWGAGTLLVGCWLIGIELTSVNLRNQLTGEDVALSVALAALFFQAPLWALRVCFGWRSQRERDALADSEVHWSLQDMLAGTALVALSLSLARLVIYHRDFWLTWIEFSLFACFLSSYTVGPAMVLTLRSWSWRFGAMLFLISVSLVGGIHIGMREGIGRLLRQPLFLPISLLPLLFFAVGLLLATFVARRLGYRLAWGHRKRARAPQTTAP